MWTIVITLRDAKGATSKIELHIPGAQLLSAVIAFVEFLLPLLDTIVGGAITGYSANYAGDIDALGLKASPVAQTDVEEGALFVYGSVGGYTSRMRLPTFYENQLVSGSRQVDMTNTDVLAFTGAILNGLGGANPCDSRGADITAVISAKELFQKSRRL